ncbi:transporter, outer bacterial membrane secretin (Secretin) family [Acidobacterium capsulatum ATCC 51196]|uniref:Transporter, outer bacterial membrane secretin (Secretin) family n=2 Tax=Acidobacteriaceae TaxID=204434 RepID=C1F241_ACIC5|nr:transporter, outer bacterial membrane secretin (Secretin) family [Acidobacterium capsulatum ATCC 51196]
MQSVTSERPLFAAQSKAAANKKPKKQDAVSVRDRNRAEALAAKGTRALLAKQAREAMLDFEHAAKLDPENPRFEADAKIAREHLVTELVQQAHHARMQGHPMRAQKLLTEALQLDPHNAEVTQHFDDLPPVGAAGFDAGKDIQVSAPPVALDPLPGEHSFHLYASAQTLLRQVMQAWNIDAASTSEVENQPVRFYVDHVGFEQALHAVELATNTFAVPLDPARVLFVPDTPENRLQYERLAMETVRLRGVPEHERTHLIEIAHNAFNIKQASYDASQQALTLRGPERDLKGFNETLTQLLQGQSEILLDVRMYEIDLTHAHNVGAELPNQSTVFNIPSELNSVINNNQSLIQEIISSGLASPGDYAAIAAILIGSGAVTNSILDSPFAYFGGGLTLTGLTFGNGGTLNGSLTASAVHSLDQMQILAQNHEDEEVRSGTRYPIITSSYSNLSSSSTSIAGLTSPGVSSALQSLGISSSSLLSTEETIPQVQYEDLGLTLHVTPSVTGRGNVALKLDLKLDTLEGQSLNSIPVLNDRELTAITTVKPGSSAMIMSSMSQQLSNAVTGIPGLSELPGFGNATNSDASKNISRLVIVVTPRIVRRVHAEEAGPVILFPAH